MAQADVGDAGGRKAAGIDLSRVQTQLPEALAPEPLQVWIDDQHRKPILTARR